MSDAVIDDVTGEVTERPRIGRPRRVAETRGRPAVKAISDETDDGGSTITRRSRRDGSSSDFDVPASARKPGWDYEYKTISIMGQAVDGAELNRYRDGGWREVRSSEIPSLCPPGYKGKNIERYGMILMTRPMRLTIEARQEDYEIAEKQKQDKLEAASAVNTNRPKSMPTVITEMSIEGSVGTHRAA